MRREPTPKDVLETHHFRTSDYLMTFEDLCALYLVFNSPLEVEKAELCFYFVFWLRE
jgi:hypothetical protein